MNVETKAFGPRELAERAGVSTDTLRHYERKGLLPHPARTRGGYRRYPPEALPQVMVIRRALLVGFSLDELGRVLRERERGGTPCRGVRALVADRLAVVDREIAALHALKKELRLLLHEWDGRLAGTPAGCQARLLETLTAHPDLAGQGRPRTTLNRGRR